MFRRIFKTYNKKNLASFSISAAFALIAPLVTTLFTQFTTLYWIAIAASVILVLVFLFISFNYVDSFHRYFELMKLDEQSCLRISAFLFAMSKAKEYNDSYKLKTLTVRYDIKDPVELATPNGKKRLYYPFTVTYRVRGTATNISSEYSFHLLQHPNNEKNNYSNFEYGFTGTNGEVEWHNCEKANIKNIGNQVWQYKFKGPRVTAFSPVDYSLRIHFTQFAGISELEKDRISRLLIYPRNFSEHFDSNAAITSIEIYVPDGFIKKVSTPAIRVFLEGKNPDPNGRQEEMGHASNLFLLTERIILKKDVFCAIEFRK